VARWQVKK